MTWTTKVSLHDTTCMTGFGFRFVSSVRCCRRLISKVPSGNLGWDSAHNGRDKTSVETYLLTHINNRAHNSHREPNRRKQTRSTTSHHTTSITSQAQPQIIPIRVIIHRSSSCSRTSSSSQLSSLSSALLQPMGIGVRKDGATKEANSM